MKLTKDEARILHSAISEMKYEFNDRLNLSNIDSFTDLENKLWEFSKDSRRIGRKSDNSFNEVLKRFSNKYKQKFAF
jgi:hypothetical protein